ncbi:nitroreductase family deazaflavin-dependent oxidoreductase [Williamsia sterculiae]|uniref:Deazaflavin-dependent oxidoreductase, nitroreductase family n=1 Tax=Williamsia sterculiae TaxID=1344003 RepID=A0A1N7CL49_9NOCA|nr:nitroreductase family deazaflavin-dependent oxidoreductase [Williamsia sterculiae]SIR64273.1 deazaflavin-dependent oxidoreductase, nitroreductase family [Williamsia sterculiae]
MQLPQSVARFNRRVTNPILLKGAGRLPLFGILYHQGRRSGRPYRTPVNVFATDDGVALALTYGPDRDWLKNIVAAGEVRIRTRGRMMTLVRPRVVPKADADEKVIGPGRALFVRVPVEKAVLLHWV